MFIDIEEVSKEVAERMTHSQKKKKWQKIWHVEITVHVSGIKKGGEGRQEIKKSGKEELQ